MFGVRVIDRLELRGERVGVFGCDAARARFEIGLADNDSDSFSLADSSSECGVDWLLLCPLLTGGEVDWLLSPFEDECARIAPVLIRSCEMAIGELAECGEWLALSAVSESDFEINSAKGFGRFEILRTRGESFGVIADSGDFGSETLAGRCGSGLVSRRLSRFSCSESASLAISKASAMRSASRCGLPDLKLSIKSSLVMRRLPSNLLTRTDTSTK